MPELASCRICICQALVCLLAQLHNGRLKHRGIRIPIAKMQVHVNFFPRGGGSYVSVEHGRQGLDEAASGIFLNVQDTNTAFLRQKG